MKKWVYGAGAIALFISAAANLIFAALAIFNGAAATDYVAASLASCAMARWFHEDALDEEWEQEHKDSNQSHEH